MSEEKSKFINFGQTVQFDKKDGSGSFQKIQIDAASVTDLINFLCEYEEKYLKDAEKNLLPKGDIWDGQKLKYNDPNVIPRITIFMSTPNERAPGFVVNNLSINKEDV